MPSTPAPPSSRISDAPAPPSTPSGPSPPSGPSRRRFFALLGAAAAALAAGHRAGVLPQLIDPDEDRPRSPWTGTTRWIGHC